MNQPNTRYMPFMVRWQNGTYSIFLGTGNYPIFEILDEQGDPGGAEARQIPLKFAGFICIDQNDVGEKLELLGCEYFGNLDELWNACTKRLFVGDTETMEAGVKKMLGIEKRNS